MFICEIGIIILICQKLGLIGSGQENIKLPSPYQLYKLLEKIEKLGGGGRIQQMNSSGMIYPFPLITLAKLQRLSINFVCYYFLYA